jgi:hypothetical protein
MKHRPSTLLRFFSVSLTAFAFLAVTILLPFAEARADSEVDPGVQASVNTDRKTAAQKGYAQDARTREQVSNPENVVQTDKIKALFTGISAALTYAKAPLMLSQLFSSQMMSGLNSMMNLMGGFGTGGMQIPIIPKITSGPETGNACIVASATPDAAPTGAGGKLLANPIAAVFAMPIAAGGGAVCPGGSQKGKQNAACDESNFSNTDAADSNNPPKSPTSPHTNQFESEKIE